MSWDAYLYDDRGHCELDQNYTHNCNRMIAAALEDSYGTKVEPFDDHPISKIIGPAWWKELDGKSGPDGAEYLSKIITALEADPAKYRAMDPPNGWGSYETLLPVLRKMRDAVPAWPTEWRVNG